MPKNFPLHWGDPPSSGTGIVCHLPGGYGMGSKELSKWIMQNLQDDEDSGDYESVSPPPGPPRDPMRTPTADMRWILASLLGKDGETAKEMIVQKMPSLAEIKIVQEDDAANSQGPFNSKRVKLYVDKDGNVCKIPKVG